MSMPVPAAQRHTGESMAAGVATLSTGAFAQQMRVLSRGHLAIPLLLLAVLAMMMLPRLMPMTMMLNIIMMTIMLMLMMMMMMIMLIIMMIMQS